MYPLEQKDILFIMSDRDVYDSLGIRYNLMKLDAKYENVTLSQIDKCLHSMEKNRDIYLWKETPVDDNGKPLLMKKVLKCQITQHGLKKIRYLIKKGRLKIPR